MSQKKSKIWKEPVIRMDLNLHIDENSPFLIRKMEAAIKSLQETPLPEWVLNRQLPAKEPIISASAPAAKTTKRQKKHS
jgi:hypothetical protein